MTELERATTKGDQPDSAHPSYTKPGKTELVSVIVRLMPSKRKAFKVATAKKGETMQAALKNLIDDYVARSEK